VRGSLERERGAGSELNLHCKRILFGGHTYGLPLPILEAIVISLCGEVPMGLYRRVKFSSYGPVKRSADAFDKAAP